tara:strand:+ start:238 stop:564 length:327 start_codon:yes stop_codon:yes gene_type:complete
VSGFFALVVHAVDDQPCAEFDKLLTAATAWLRNFISSSYNDDLFGFGLRTLGSDHGHQGSTFSADTGGESCVFDVAAKVKFTCCFGFQACSDLKARVRAICVLSDLPS